MEGLGGANFLKKRRSMTSRRPRADSQLVFEGAPHSSDQNLGNLESGESLRKVKREERKYGDVNGFYRSEPGNGLDSKRCSEGALAPANWKSLGNGGGGGGGIVGAPKKVKLKVGGITRTFQPKSSSEIDGGSSGYNARPSGPADPARHRQKLVLQDTSDDDQTPAEKGDGVQNVGGVNRGLNEHSRSKVFEESSYGKQMHLSDAIRKSKRVPKRRKVG